MRGEEGHSKCLQLRIRGGDVIHYVYVRTCTISFHGFGSINISYLVLFIGRRCIDIIFTFPKSVHKAFILALIQGVFDCKLGHVGKLFL